MTRPSQDIEDDKPLDPAVERVRAKLMRFVIVNLAILFVAVMAVVGAIVYRSLQTGSGDDAATELAAADGPIEAEITLPEGARVIGHSHGGGRVSLLVEGPEGREVIVYDLAGQRIIARLRFTSGQ